MLTHRGRDGKGAAMDVDVAIVGAGAAGIAASRRLRALGIAHVVLEAAHAVTLQVVSLDDLKRYAVRLQ